MSQYSLPLLPLQQEVESNKVVLKKLDSETLLQSLLLVCLN